jgi:hypothetical protein
MRRRPARYPCNDPRRLLIPGKPRGRAFAWARRMACQRLAYE